MASIVRCCRVEDSSTDLHQTPTDALAMVKDMSSLQHSDGSDDSRKWGNLSPFSEDHSVSCSSIQYTDVRVTLGST